MEYLTELPPLSSDEIELMETFRRDILPNIKKPIGMQYKPAVVVKVRKSSTVHQLRDIGHKYFDMIWRDLKLVSRNELYGYLAENMGLPPEKAHFTFFNPQQCIEALEYSIQMLNDNRRLDLDLISVEPTPYFELIIK